MRDFITALDCYSMIYEKHYIETLPSSIVRERQQCELADEARHTHDREPRTCAVQYVLLDFVCGEPRLCRCVAV